MNRVLAGTGVAIGFLLQTMWWPEITLLVAPAWLLSWAAAWGATRNLEGGYWLAIIGGLLLDLFAGSTFGLFTVASLVSYGIFYMVVSTRPASDSGPFILLVFAVTAALYEILVLLGLLVTTGNLPFFALLVQVATLNTVGTVVVFSFTLFALTMLRSTTSYGPRPIQY